MLLLLYFYVCLASIGHRHCKINASDVQMQSCLTAE